MVLDWNGVYTLTWAVKYTANLYGFSIAVNEWTNLWVYRNQT